MKTPIVYYGGKQKMIKHILPHIPNHTTYVEPFAGGAAVFFAKPKSKAEFINDINGNIAAFYRSMVIDFDGLQKMIESTIHCENTFKRAKDIYLSTNLYSDTERAWAVWVNSCLSFGGQMASSFKWQRSKNDNWTAPTTMRNKKKIFKFLKSRLDGVTVFNRDAIAIIKKLDDTDTFFYIDPPYIGANQGHYSGYTEEDFLDLITVLLGIKGKFILSHYPFEGMPDVWSSISFNMALGVNPDKRKIEVITMNFEKNEPNQLKIF